MAHVQKNTMAACGNLFEHYARALDNNKAINQRKANKNIDINRTHLNYNLCPHQLNRIQDQTDILQKRLSEVKCLKRKDVNVMCSWVVTIPQDLLAEHPEKQKDFFKETYKFLANRYGEKNVISSWVHMDETTPHMHFAFIPVAFDKKKGIEHVSAYKVINRTELNNFHPDLQAYLEQKLGVKCNVLNGATENGNRTVAELKAEKDVEFYQKKANRMKEEYQSLRRDLNDIKNEYVLVEIHKDQAKRDLETFNLEKESLQEEVNSLRENKKALQNDNANLRSDLISLGFQLNKLKSEKEEYIKQKEKAALLTSQAVREVLQQAHEEFNKILETAAKHDVNDNIVKQVTEQVVERFEKKAPEESKKEVKAELQHEADEVVQCIRRRRGR